MTLSSAMVISKKDSPKVIDFKKKLAIRDNLKLIKKKYNKIKCAE